MTVPTRRSAAQAADDPRRGARGRGLPGHGLARAQRRPLRQPAGAGRGRRARSARPGTSSTSTPAAWSPSAPTRSAFLLTEPQERLFEDPNFNVLLRGCTQALAEHDITAAADASPAPTDERRARQPLRHRRPRRRRAAGLHPLRRPAARRAARARACRSSPAARPLGHEREISYVAADDRDGARADGRAPAVAGPPADRA